jgi:hypothetical protein
MMVATDLSLGTRQLKMGHRQGLTPATGALVQLIRIGGRR